MTSALVVRAVETSGYQSDAPTRAEITDAMQRVVGQTHTGANGQPVVRAGHWAGPAPRVTRWADLTGNKTFATWVFVIPSDVIAPDFAQRLADDVAASLAAHASHHAILGSAWEVRTAPYNAAINGPQSWWESDGPDSASRQARFVDTFPPVGAQVIPGAVAPVPDNHDGPNDLHPVPDEGNPLLWVGILGGVAVVGLALVELGPAISAWARGRATPAKTPNPHRPRR